MLERKYPKDILLGNGREVLLRPLDEADALRLSTFYGELPPLERWCFGEDPREEEVVRQWIGEQTLGHAFGIVGLSGDRIVGHGCILLNRFGGRRHVSRLRLAVSPQFRKQELGRWMVLDLTRRAMEFGVEILVAELVTGLENETIQALKKLEFQCQVTFEGGFRTPDGQRHDTVLLMRTLHAEWSDF